MAVFQGRADKPQLVLGSVLDYFTSALLAYGVAAALFRREHSAIPCLALGCLPWENGRRPSTSIAAPHARRVYRCARTTASES